MTTDTPTTPPRRHGLRHRTGRRALVPVAGIALAAALLAGCGTSLPEQPVESSSPVSVTAASANVFAGTWTVGRSVEALDAQELADLLESEAEARGPEEMSVDVECEDGFDVGAGDDTASCIAYADEGVEHPWEITIGPPDAGSGIEVENVG